MQSRLITPAEAARLLGVSPATLGTLRSIGRYNLPYVKIGRKVLYRVKDVEEFIERRTRRHTGEEAA